jgi:hypothetical protein
MTRHALAAFLFLAFGVAGVALAADPAGTWKWKTKRGDKEFEQTLKLEVKDGKVTGTITGGRGGTNETKIEDGKFKDGELSFTVTRERGDMKFVTKYSGKVSEDSIKGTITSDRGGKENKQDWEAKREKKKD